MQESKYRPRGEPPDYDRLVDALRIDVDPESVKEPTYEETVNGYIQIQMNFINRKLAKLWRHWNNAKI